MKKIINQAPIVRYGASVSEIFFPDSWNGTFSAESELMLDLADVRAGSRVLDVAAGTGDQTLFAGRRVGSNGYVLATDISASMLDIAAATAEKNPYQGIILNVARRFGSTPLPLFVLGEGNVLENTFKDCGFYNVAVRAVNHRRHFSSTAEIFQSLKESAHLRQPIEKLGETEREQAWLEIERQLSRLEGPSGIEVPGEFLIGVGTK